MLKMIDLFSGIGGFSLAASWTGEIKTIAFCEIDKFCQRVLKKNFPGVPIHDDIKTFTYTEKTGINGEMGNIEQEGCRSIEFNSSNKQTRIDILCGGFPCQPFSAAGRRKGTDDNRYLWPEMLRVIREVRPTWVIAENVSGLLTIGDGMVFEGCCADLEAEGYEVQPFVIPACAVNAPHRRDRVWIVARANADDTESRGCGLLHTENIGKTARKVNASTDTDCHASDTERGNGGTGLREDGTEQDGDKFTDCGGNAPDTDLTRPQGRDEYGQRAGERTPGQGYTEQWAEDWYTVALRTCVRGISNGFSEWLDRSGIKLEVDKYAKAIIAVARQDMPGLRESIQQEEVWKTVRGFNEVSVKEVLFAVLRQCGGEPNYSWLSGEGEENADIPMRDVRNDGEPSYTSQGRGCNKQCSDEYSNLMCELSSQISLAAVEAYKTHKAVPSNRVNRLKALGNAIVPQVAYEIFMAILKAERDELNMVGNP